jgi:scyllo-inositol 2-dehydrogenase (NADP+)
MTQLKVAIIGQGRSGRDIHAYSLSKLPDIYRIVAVADESEERCNLARTDYGCDTYADYRELFALRDLDLIVNASPSHLHVTITLDCLNHGFNVLCEKPLARTKAEVDILSTAAVKAGKVLAVYQQSRYSPAFTQVKKVIDSGVLGRIVQVGIAYNGFARRWDWQTLKAKNGGNLLNTGPHPVDQALQLFGPGEMPQVTCMMDQANSFGDAEDYVKLILRGEGHPNVEVEISSCCAYPTFNYHVQGTQGGLKGTFDRLDWKYFKPEETQNQKLVSSYLKTADGKPAYCTEELKWYEESWVVPTEQGKDMFHSMATAYYSMLHNTLLNGEPLEVTLSEVRRQIAVIEECFRQNPLFSIEETESRP